MSSAVTTDGRSEPQRRLGSQLRERGHHPALDGAVVAVAEIVAIRQLDDPRFEHPGTHAVGQRLVERGRRLAVGGVEFEASVQERRQRDGEGLRVAVGTEEGLGHEQRGSRLQHSRRDVDRADEREAHDPDVDIRGRRDGPGCRLSGDDVGQDGEDADADGARRRDQHAGQDVGSAPAHVAVDPVVQAELGDDMGGSVRGPGHAAP